MYLLVFLTRYMDLFSHFISVYNTVFKILFISATGYIIFLIRFKKPYSVGYDPKLDSFNHYLFLYPPVLVMTVLFHLGNPNSYFTYEYLWSFSVWLEAVAIVPQLIIVYRKREVEIITGSYMACLGCYKIFYVISWIYQYLLNSNLIWIKFVAGAIQIGIYFDYLYFYFVSAKVSANTIKLPV